MAKEIEYQSRIIDSVKLQGGYGRKWGSQFQVGVPDLVLSLPEFGVFLMEVKLERDCYPEFERKAGGNPKQTHELLEFDEAGALVVLGTVIEMRNKDRHLIISSPRVQQVSYRDLNTNTLWRGTKEKFDIVGQMLRYLRGKP